ncbi:unnamed protein product [Moneuplotes crassus]|uniref:Uncharacterized protein n=1 Tax=Euplotes crassus TaxID=5936 RepID=A0AAD1X7V5_EUPCR|nr:unnamed protein product [Moneuplotes crassus]
MDGSNSKKRDLKEVEKYSRGKNNDESEEMRLSKVLKMTKKTKKSRKPSTPRKIHKILDLNDSFSNLSFEADAIKNPHTRSTAQNPPPNPPYHYPASTNPPPSTRPPSFLLPPFTYLRPAPLIQHWGYSQLPNLPSHHPQNFTNKNPNFLLSQAQAGLYLQARQPEAACFTVQDQARLEGLVAFVRANYCSCRIDT